MSQYLSIGKVSKLKNVSIKSLRYYDEIGVFRPAYINTETNYRYYTEEQLPMLDIISTCIELGLPLKDLENYVTEGEFDLNRLMDDCKVLAESKIQAIYHALSVLKNASENGIVVDNRSEQESTPEPISEDSEKSPEVRSLPERTVLMIPYEEEENLQKKILRLLMLSQLIGIEASYPSGILHRYEGDTYERFAYITVTDAKGSLDNRITTIPGGDYEIHPISEHLSFRPDRSALPELSDAASATLLLEADAIQAELDTEFPYEVQFIK